MPSYRHGPRRGCGVIFISSVPHEGVAGEIYVKQEKMAAGEHRATRLPPRRWRRAALAAAAISLLAVVAAAPVSASPDTPRDFWGVVPISDLSRPELEQMGTGNVGSLRQLTMWPAIEPNPNEYNWGNADFLVANAARNGIEILPFLYGTPGWVKGVKCNGVDTEQCQRVPPLSRKARPAWANFLRTIVGRYGTHGSFWSDTSDSYSPPYVPITQWQIWNEPNSPTYWRPRPEAEDYAKLVKRSYDVIAEVDPAAEIVLAGVFPNPEGGVRNWIGPYMTDFYGVRGVRKHFDIAAIHPYAKNIKVLRKEINGLRRIMRRGGAANKPMLITELGWGSAPPAADGPLGQGEQGQRDLLAESFELLAAQRSAWKLAGVFWYSWRDPGYTYPNCTFCSSAGLLNAKGDPKPAWHAFVDVTGGVSQPPPPEPPPDPPPPPPDDPIPPILP